MAGFLYPFTETMDLEPADLAGCGPDELRVMRNEINARGGLIFEPCVRSSPPCPGTGRSPAIPARSGTR